MKKDWLWDKDISESELKEAFANRDNPRFISLVALLLSRKNSAKEVFKEYIKRDDFFVRWNSIKRQMRKNSWNDPRIEYWQAIYDTLKKKVPELSELKQPEFEESLFALPREIGEKIREARERSGLTQRKLAEKPGISQQIISRIESGKHNISLETLEKVCRSLGIPLNAEKLGLYVEPEASGKTLDTLPFSSKSPEEFVKVCYEIIARSKEFDEPVQYYDGMGDKQRDIIAYKYNIVGKKEQWYFQCKRYTKIGFSTFKEELNKIAEHSKKDKYFCPDGIVFVTACRVGAPAKDKAKEHAKKIGLGEVIFWTDIELTVKAKAAGIYDDLFTITHKNLKESSEELADQASKLAPRAPHNLLLKARTLMARAQTETIIPSPFEVIPKFKKYEEIEKALELLKQALEIAEKEENKFLVNQIKYDINCCLLWLRRFEAPEYKENRENIDFKWLDSTQQMQLGINDVLVQIQKRNFETAYEMFIASNEWGKLRYKDKTRIAHIFFLRGAPQQSKDILSQLEEEAKTRKDVQFWIDMSLNEVLLNNKNLAMRAAQEAKEFSAGTPMEKTILSHYNALMFRYAPSNEVDRLMPGLFEYDKKYPGDKVVWPIKVIEEDGKISEEFKPVLLKQKDWYEGIKNTFRLEPIPSYWLEKKLRRPYAQILSFRWEGELDFTIELTIPNELFEKELLNNLEIARHLVFDYASLLNFSKMNLLGHLEKFGKQISISVELFNKIQDELLAVEQEDLRNLWRFLRQARGIKIVEDIQPSFKNEKYPELFDKWIIETSQIAKDKNAVFVIDDLRLLKFFRSEEKLKVCNSFIILKSMLGRGWIDSKIYSTAIGGLAERFYTFLPFSGDDLFQIVMEDKAKIKPRSRHLINQLLLPGSTAESFTKVFVKFIDLLWRTGSLPEDKVEWLFLLTGKILEFIDSQGGVENNQELEKAAPDFVQMWIIAVQRSSRDEIALLEKEADSALNKPYLAVFKDSITRFIQAKNKNLITK